MIATDTALTASLAGDPLDTDDRYLAFSGWVGEQGITLYPAQDEALLELVTGNNVVLATPTGSGKSLVATGAHYFALAAGVRSVYTAPIKALVSEKFFALCDVFGSANVGMMTGDSAVNPTRVTDSSSTSPSAAVSCATVESTGRPVRGVGNAPPAARSGDAP